MTRVLGPSEMDPYAVQWEEQPMNILKGFIVYFPDMAGFDKSAADVKEWSKEQAVAECIRIQQFCPKAIDKPWAVTVQEALGDGQRGVWAQGEGAGPQSITEQEQGECSQEEEWH